MTVGRLALVRSALQNGKLLWGDWHDGSSVGDAVAQGGGAGVVGGRLKLCVLHKKFARRGVAQTEVRESVTNRRGHARDAHRNLQVGGRCDARSAWSSVQVGIFVIE